MWPVCGYLGVCFILIETLFAFDSTISSMVFFFTLWSTYHRCLTIAVHLWLMEDWRPASSLRYNYILLFFTPLMLSKEPIIFSRSKLCFCLLAKLAFLWNTASLYFSLIEHELSSATDYFNKQHASGFPFDDLVYYCKLAKTYKNFNIYSMMHIYLSSQSKLVICVLYQ